EPQVTERPEDRASPVVGEMLEWKRSVARQHFEMTLPQGGPQTRPPEIPKHAGDGRQNTSQQSEGAPPPGVPGDGQSRVEGSSVEPVPIKVGHQEEKRQENHHVILQPEGGAQKNACDEVSR